jgi:hypothetical protein
MIGGRRIVLELLILFGVMLLLLGAKAVARALCVIVEHYWPTAFDFNIPDCEVPPVKCKPVLRVVRRKE